MGGTLGGVNVSTSEEDDQKRTKRMLKKMFQRERKRRGLDNDENGEDGKEAVERS